MSAMHTYEANCCHTYVTSRNVQYCGLTWQVNDRMLEVLIQFRVNGGKDYLKHEANCFIRYKTRERSLCVLYLIKQGLRVFYMAYI